MPGLVGGGRGGGRVDTEYEQTGIKKKKTQRTTIKKILFKII